MSRRYHAVLTGASGGIGRAIAEAIAPDCHALVLVGRDAVRLRDVAAAVGPAALPVVADLSTVAGRDAVAAATRRANLLVQCAGTTAFGWLASQDDATLERIMATNAIAPMQLTRRLLPLLQREPEAWIVNVGSIFGYLGYPGHAAYSASKFALRGFGEALRRELAGGPVRVLHFAPRATRTPMNVEAVGNVNGELGVAMDAPEAVAAQLVELLRRPSRERLLGIPEAFFARVNQLLPGLVDRALRRQLPAIRRHLPAHTGDER